MTATRAPTVAQRQLSAYLDRWPITDDGISVAQCSSASTPADDEKAHLRVAVQPERSQASQRYRRTGPGRSPPGRGRAGGTHHRSAPPSRSPGSPVRRPGACTTRRPAPVGASGRLGAAARGIVTRAAQRRLAPARGLVGSAASRSAAGRAPSNCSGGQRGPAALAKCVTGASSAASPG
jgi:hypothetical protein